MKQNKAAMLTFSKMSTSFEHSLFMDIKGPWNPASEGAQYIYVFVDHFSNYIVTEPPPKILLIML